MNARAPRRTRLVATVIALLPFCVAHAQEHQHAPAVPKVDHSQMDHSQMDHSQLELPDDPAVPRPPTPEERAAAFPVLDAHPMGDDAIHAYVVLNRLEAWDDDGAGGLLWEGHAWIGTDTRRLWLRSEGERIGGDTHAGDLEVLYGKAVSPWWDVVVGLRQDVAPGAGQTWASVGVAGLAPQKFDVAATAYVGASGRTAARVEVDYDLLLSNRWILQPRLEANVFGKDDFERGTGAGLATVEGGLRLRYEVTRRFAPYIGLVRERAFGRTAALRRAQGEDDDAWRVVAGVRLWF